MGLKPPVASLDLRGLQAEIGEPPKFGIAFYGIDVLRSRQVHLDCV